MPPADLKTRFSGDDFRVDPDVASASTLPVEAFTDPEYLKLELATLFRRNWLLVPQRAVHENDDRSLAEAVKLRGARLPFTLLGRPFFLQRDWKSRLHCFPNVCTHAWYPLVDGPDRKKTIVCAQHGRAFACDGKFSSQSGFSPKTVKDFPRDCDHLQGLPVDSWGEFFFAALGEPDLPLKRLLDPMIKSVSRMPVSRFTRGRHEEVREVDGNWKLHGWNYMDKFHISFIHRAPEGLADALDLSSYKTELHDKSSLQWAYARNPEHGFNPQHLPTRFRDPKYPDRRVFALWWFVFPNMTFNFYPWGLSVNAYMPTPHDPGKTLFLWYHYVWDEKKYKRRDELWLSSQVDAEDIHAMKQVRRGTLSGFAPRGRFAPGEESGPHWYHRLAYESVFA